MPAHERPTRPRHLWSVGSPDNGPVSDDEFIRRQTDLFESLTEYVGAEALWSFDFDPLPDDAFEWSGVQAVDRSFVAEVLRLVDEGCDALLDAEYRTIVRRLLARVAACDPRPLRRSPHAGRCAAGLVWLAGQTSGGFSRRGRPYAGWIWSWFGVGNCADRGRTMWRAAGFGDPEDPWDHTRDPLVFGDASLLHSGRRAELIRRRDYLSEIAIGRRTLEIESSDGLTAQVRVRAQPARAVTALKARGEDGKAIVVVGFGAELDDAKYLSLGVPDAHDLVHMLQHALDAPIPHLGAS